MSAPHGPATWVGNDAWDAHQTNVGAERPARAGQFRIPPIQNQPQRRRARAPAPHFAGFLLRGFFVFISSSPFTRVGCVSAHRVGDFLILVGFEGHTRRTSLPGWRRTFRVRHIVFRGFAERSFSVPACGVPPGIRPRTVSCHHRKLRNRRRSRDTNWPPNNRNQIQAELIAET